MMMLQINDKTVLYENEIEKALQSYADEKGVDLYEVGQSRWTSALIYTYKSVFEGTDKLTYIKRTEYNGSMAYKVEEVAKVLQIYVEQCLEHSKEISIDGFCRLTGIHKDTIYEWNNNGDSDHRAIYRALYEGREETLAYKLDGGKNPIGTIAKLNHFYGWSSGTTEEVEKTRSRLSRAEVLQIADARPTEPIEMPGTSQLFTRKF